MAMVVVFFAAVVVSAAALVIPESKNLRIRQLALAYWAVWTLMLAMGFAQGGGVDAFLHMESLGDHTASGIAVAALILLVWTVFCLFNGFGRGDER